MAINPIGVKQSSANPQFTGVVDKVVGSKAFESIAKFAGEKPAVFNAASSLVLAGVLRPATIMALPGKGENATKNKATAAAHAIASAVIGFAITSTVMKPISAGLKKVMGDTSKYLPKLSEKMNKDPKFAANVNKVLSFGPDILLAVPRALLTSKLSGYVNKALFGKKKEAEKPVAQVAQAPVAAQPAAQAVEVQTTQRPVLDNFKGGTV